VDTYADDLAKLVEALDLENAIHVAASASAVNGQQQEKKRCR
jgi:hypothetical protein